MFLGDPFAQDMFYTDIRDLLSMVCKWFYNCDLKLLQSQVTKIPYIPT